ncbi:hypothetical protein X772_08645 [Mesorhizobium sp. LSJC280B00]|nr:hypothetical protein X772_08645 [Mesorhizobium sp. LSJC280B00]
MPGSLAVVVRMTRTHAKAGSKTKVGSKMELPLFRHIAYSVVLPDDTGDASVSE